ncbi:hypothetical protein BP6252_12451 [Coleophoma cylindrospora]|uniref:Epoxide hydrolase N-terminal domain-containing protein n=1 Tax=Coleophoma cylindrospora TaxID=1849047 RepID=A0A3D8QH97_9HELO|nr:hypothetical protein BP6252_12451 [Coleophoma cylindrospora]
MFVPFIQYLAFALLSIRGAECTGLQTTPSFNLRPFSIDLSNRVPTMLSKINETQLPDLPEYPGVGSSFGINLDTLKSFQQEWLTSFNWEKEQSSINQFNHFEATIENLTIHFIHEKSKCPNAIPLLLLHGWPSSFLEFVPLINQLVQRANISYGKSVSFNIIVPSLPGFAFSSPPPANWTVVDTARVFNTLMTDVLGYSTFAVHGTDFGVGPAYVLYDQYNKTTRAAHLVFLPFFPLTPTELQALNITLSPLEEFEEQRFIEWDTFGLGYFLEQSTKPNTLGLALYDNPIGQLAWIGEKYINGSDPRAGTGGSLLNSNEILLSVSLYYLSQCFVSSVYIYAQNPGGFSTNYTKARTDAPLLFSAFKYNIGFWPPALVAKVGNLVSYRNHYVGGHFPALENPSALIADLREIGTYWTD